VAGVSAGWIFHRFTALHACPYSAPPRGALPYIRPHRHCVVGRADGTGAPAYAHRVGPQSHCPRRNTIIYSFRHGWRLFLPCVPVRLPPSARTIPASFSAFCDSNSPCMPSPHHFLSSNSQRFSSSTAAALLPSLRHSCACYDISPCRNITYLIFRGGTWAPRLRAYPPYVRACCRTRSRTQLAEPGTPRCTSSVRRMVEQQARMPARGTRAAWARVRMDAILSAVASPWLRRAFPRHAHLLPLPSAYRCTLPLSATALRHRLPLLACPTANYYPRGRDEQQQRQSSTRLSPVRATVLRGASLQRQRDASAAIVPSSSLMHTIIPITPYLTPRLLHSLTLPC